MIGYLNVIYAKSSKSEINVKNCSFRINPESGEINFIQVLPVVFGQWLSPFHHLTEEKWA